MNKAILTVAAALLVAGASIRTADALPPGYIETGREPVQPSYGIWKASVRYSDSHTGPDGRHYTHTYHHIAQPSRAACESELQTWINAGVEVTTFCYWSGF